MIAIPTRKNLCKITPKIEVFKAFMSYFKDKYLEDSLTPAKCISIGEDILSYVETTNIARAEQQQVRFLLKNSTLITKLVELNTFFLFLTKAMFQSRHLFYHAKIRKSLDIAFKKSVNVEYTIEGWLAVFQSQHQLVMLKRILPYKDGTQRIINQFRYGMSVYMKRYYHVIFLIKTLFGRDIQTVIASYL